MSTPATPPASPPASAASFAEISAILAQIPAPDAAAAAAAQQRQNSLTKPQGALGRLEELAIWLASWQTPPAPRLQRPRVLVFAGNHGMVSHGVSAFPASVTTQMVQNFVAGGAAVNQLCEVAGAELRVFEMALERPTADFTQGPAMSEEECARAMAYGMMAVEEGLDLYCLGEMGIGNSTAAAAVACALFGGSPAAWVGPGTGLDPAGIARKIAVVEAGLAANPAARTDPFEALRCLGGHELAALTGAVLAARIGRFPVVLDGYATTVAAAVLFKAAPQALEHCLVSHCSAEPGHSRLLATLGQKPLLDFGMRLGEASGAALVIPLLKSAVACHNGMATFSQAKVSEKTPGP